MTTYTGPLTQTRPDQGASNTVGTANTQTIALLPVKRHLAGVVFDGVLREDHKSEMKITAYPSEDGTPLNEHAQLQQRELTIEIGVSDIMGAPNDAFSTNTAQTRSRNAWELMKSLQASKVPFAVQTGLELYRDMLIANLSSSQDVATSRALILTLNLKQVLFSSPQQVAYVGATKTGGAGGTQDKGAKPGEKSGAAALVDYVMGANK